MKGSLNTSIQIMTRNILRVFSMKYLILLFLSCNTIQTGISNPPEIQSFIEEIKSNPEIREIDKKRIISTLEISSEYNSKCYERNNLLEKENFLLQRKIQELYLEIQTWRTVKKGFWILLFTSILIFIGSVAWKFRKLFGSPI